MIMVLLLIYLIVCIAVAILGTRDGVELHYLLRDHVATRRPVELLVTPIRFLRHCCSENLAAER